MDKPFTALLIKNDLTVKGALKRMDEAGGRILFVVDENQRLKGSVTDGDIRRWILKEGDLNEVVEKIHNHAPRFVHEGYQLATVQEMMTSQGVTALPVINDKGVLTDVLSWDDVFSKDLRPEKGNLEIPVLVMAGGKGTRLDPFTKILPKPLIPFGDKPIIELIMDRFSEFGCHKFFLTVNYKGKMIQSYFDHADNKYNVDFVWEEKFLGTAGSIKHAASLIDAPHFFISNCDIMIRADYADIHKFHLENENDITIIGSMQHISVPFGVLETRNGGLLHDVVEKPEFDFLANTGMYLVKSQVVEHIPHEKHFHFTELIAKVKTKGGKVGVYPVSQQSWIDIGQWQEFQNAMKTVEFGT